ncbi:MAG: glycine--tRNA ligase subunit beta [Fimbriimonadaceae bacterium]|nr:MAG: glycine--tRNA ligase subunit beta [Fimbriimonadaceae bacterium]
MPNLLFELGCEEMPASAVAQAEADLRDEINTRLVDSGLGLGSIQSCATPRRLIIGVEGIADHQADRSEEARGPRAGAAFDESGNPTKALEGFCRGQGISAADVFTKDDYVWFKKSIPGRAAIEVLAEIIPDAVKALKFEKTMRWGTEKARFVRPIRWILAKLDEQVIPFEIYGVSAGAQSFGHRFMSPGSFEPKNWDDHIELLKKNFVEADSDARRERILIGAKTASSGIPDLTDDLVDENTYLTEWPVAHEGAFSPEFMSLPEPVLVTAMAKHERFFPVRDSAGAITNKFISIRNNGDEDLVRKGNEWVLNARFNDARFFYLEDQKKSLDDFLAATEQMLYQDKLGTVRQRADRLANLTIVVNSALGAPEIENSDAHKAGLYAKADLSSGLVSELSSLQGVIGGEYARREGMSDRVATAIAGQYKLPKEAAEQNRLGIALLIADQLDKLAGFLGLGLIPKGSSDPFGLRRAATMLIQSAWLVDTNVDFAPLLDEAFTEYAAQGVELDSCSAVKALADLFIGRYEATMENVDHDVHDGAVGNGDWNRLSSPNIYSDRVKRLDEFKKRPETVQTFTRPLNILNSARQKNHIDSAGILVSNDLGSPQAKELLNAAQNSSDLNQLEKPIHEFFESTMVMDEDPKVRNANLQLLVLVEEKLLEVGDFTKLVFEG